jgi:signal transduction histidine kinase
MLQLKRPGAVTDPNAAPRRTVEWTILLLVFGFVAVLHSAAMQDRFLLMFYSIGIAGAAFVLVRRRAFVFAVVVVSLAATVLLSNVYFSAAGDSWHPLVDPVRDVIALGVLLFLVAKLIFEAYRIQQEDIEHEFKRQLETKTVEIRAAALRSTSHEVRTPLSTIIAVNEMLLTESAGPLNEDQREFLQDIDEAARHLMDLVNDILDFAKAEAGMIRIQPEPVALVELVEQCVAMVEPKAEQARVNVTGQVSPDVTEIVADPLRLKQILINLLTNAIKFNEEGGIVNVKARASGNDVLISVRDTGRGISQEQQEYLFNPYYQAAHGDQGIGTGLGLSIIKHLTELHGGSITLDSVPGTGSVFTVRLPREAKVVAEAVDATSPASAKIGEPDRPADAEEYIESVLSSS